MSAFDPWLVESRTDLHGFSQAECGGRSQMTSNMTIWVRFTDAMIAAMARVNRLIVVTRNVIDSEGLGVEVFNPFPSDSGGQV